MNKPFVSEMCIFITPWRQRKDIPITCLLYTSDMELKSLKKKYKSKGFAAGCSREVIERGADQLGWPLEKLLTMTLQAMADSEDEINQEIL